MTTMHADPLNGIGFRFTTVAGRHEVTGRIIPWHDRQRITRKTRVYVSISAEDVPLPIPPLFAEDGETPNDAAWAAYNRAEVRVMRTRLREAHAVMRAAGYAPDGSYAFSRKAGCGCGCSPGFILNGKIRAPQQHRGADNQPVEVWIS